MEYGSHKQGCPRWISFVATEGCTCGFHHVLGRLCENCSKFSKEQVTRKLIEETGMSRRSAEKFVEEFRQHDW